MRQHTITLDASTPGIRAGKQRATIKVHYSDRVGVKTQTFHVALFATVVRPDIVIEGLLSRERIDLGRLLIGERNRWQFVLRNTSDAPAWYNLSTVGGDDAVTVRPSKVGRSIAFLILCANHPQFLLLFSFSFVRLIFVLPFFNFFSHVQGVLPPQCRAVTTLDVAPNVEGPLEVRLDADILSDVGETVAHTTLCTARCEGVRPVLVVTDARSPDRSTVTLWQQLHLRELNRALNPLLAAAQPAAGLLSLNSSSQFLSLLPALEEQPQENGAGDKTNGLLGMNASSADSVEMMQVQSLAGNNNNDDNRYAASNHSGEIVLNLGSAAHLSDDTIIELALTNRSACTCGWALALPSDLTWQPELWAMPHNPTFTEEHYRIVHDNSIFQIEPKKGQLASGATCTITISYRHSLVDRHSVPVLLTQPGSTAPAIRLRLVGETLAGGNPHLDFLSRLHRFEPVPLGLLEPPVQLYALQNTSDVPAEFELDLTAVKALQDSNYGVPIFECGMPEGVVPPQSTVIVPWRFQPLEAQVYRVTVPIYIRNAPLANKPFVLELVAEGIDPRLGHASSAGSTGRMQPRVQGRTGGRSSHQQSTTEAGRLSTMGSSLKHQRSSWLDTQGSVARLVQNRRMSMVAASGGSLVNTCGGKSANGGSGHGHGGENSDIGSSRAGLRICRQSRQASLGNMQLMMREMSELELDDSLDYSGERRRSSTAGGEQIGASHNSNNSVWNRIGSGNSSGGASVLRGGRRTRMQGSYGALATMGSNDDEAVAAPLKPTLVLRGQPAQLSHTRLNFGPAPLHSVLRRLVFVDNLLGQQEISFAWDYGSYAGVVMVEPAQGVVPAGQACVCKVVFKPREGVRLYNFDVCCRVWNSTRERQREAKLRAVESKVTEQQDYFMITDQGRSGRGRAGGYRGGAALGDTAGKRLSATAYGGVLALEAFASKALEPGMAPVVSNRVDGRPRFSGPKLQPVLGQRSVVVSDSDLRTKKYQVGCRERAGGNG